MIVAEKKQLDLQWLPIEDFIKIDRKKRRERRLSGQIQGVFLAHHC
jgi:hypothetical protein